MSVWDVLCCLDWISPALGWADEIASGRSARFGVGEDQARTAMDTLKRNGIKVRPGDKFVGPDGVFNFSVEKKDRERTIDVLKRRGLL